MAIVISSLVMLAFFGIIVFSERKRSKHSREFFRKSDEMIADLASRVEQRYKDKFGKDPTGQFPTLMEKPSKARQA